MMRNTITRTIETSRIYFMGVEVVDGKPTFKEYSPLEVNGHHTMETADKLLKKCYKGNKLIVTNIEYIEQLYEISVEDFIKYATPVEK